MLQLEDRLSQVMGLPLRDRQARERLNEDDASLLEFLLDLLAHRRRLGGAGHPAEFTHPEPAESRFPEEGRGNGSEGALPGYSPRCLHANLGPHPGGFPSGRVAGEGGSEVFRCLGRLDRLLKIKLRDLLLFTPHPLKQPDFRAERLIDLLLCHRPIRRNVGDGPRELKRAEGELSLHLREHELALGVPQFIEFTQHIFWHRRHRHGPEEPRDPAPPLLEDIQDFAPNACASNPKLLELLLGGGELTRERPDVGLADGQIERGLLLRGLPDGGDIGRHAGDHGYDSYRHRRHRHAEALGGSGSEGRGLHDRPERGVELR